MTTTPINPISPSFLVPGPGKVTVTLAVEYRNPNTGHRTGGDLFIRYDDPAAYDPEHRTPGVYAAETLLDGGSESSGLLRDLASDEAIPERAWVTVKVDGVEILSVDAVEAYAWLDGFR